MVSLWIYNVKDFGFYRKKEWKKGPEHMDLHRNLPNNDDLVAMRILVTILLPMVVNYVRHHESIILKNGEPLTPDQQIDAHKIGVKNIQQVRVMQVDRMPWPEQRVLQQVAKWAGLMVGNASGVTFGHGIYIRKSYWGIRSLLVHELTHTMQYERLGGIRPFLKQYLTECLVQGYYNSPLEREAVEMERNLG